jgi:hypothetical protein
VDDLLRPFQPTVSLERHETGPILRSLWQLRDQLGPLTYRVADAINRSTPTAVGVVVRSADLAPPLTTVALPLTAEAARGLAGLLVNDDVVGVGDRWISPSKLVAHPHVEVDPGPTAVRVALPWGSWVSRVVVQPGNSATVTLPERVGIPPLRVRLLAAGAKLWAEDPPRSLVSATRTRLTGTVAGAPGVNGHIEATNRLSRSWRGPWSQAITDADRWTAHCSVETPSGLLSFPLNEHGALAVQLGRTPRVEPLSLTPSPHWDRLVSSGRLEELSGHAAVELTYDKWSSPLLGLAGAYACYAQGLDDFLTEVLTNLTHLDRALPDLPLLEAALDRRRGSRRGEVREALQRLARARSMPVFRRWQIGCKASTHTSCLPRHGPCVAMTRLGDFGWDSLPTEPKQREQGDASPLDSLPRVRGQDSFS